MNVLLVQLKLFLVDRIIRYIFTKVKQKFARKPVRILVLLFILMFYYHAYFYTVLAAKPNIYEEIGVSPKSTHQQIKTKLKQIYRETHPDKSDKSSADFIHFQSLGAILEDPNQKWMYDRFNIDKELTSQYR